MSQLRGFEFKGDRWEALKVLGKGSFGEALLVKREKDGRHAVCKRVVLSSMKPSERKEAINEVNVMSKMKHPNIVELMGSFEKDEVLHIIMEYANAGDIEGLIKGHRSRKQPLPEDVIASLFVQMAHAVRFLHERRVLHRDLKAQNVFLARRRADGPLVVKLGDFGIATVLRNTHALAKTVCGTPYYFSPELCLNKPYNNKTDIWSLGCILYELCTLRHAFDATNMKSLVARILKGNYEPISSRYSSDLGKLVDVMLQQKSALRPCITEVLVTPFVKRCTLAMCNKDMMQTIAGGLTKGIKGGSSPQSQGGSSGSMLPPISAGKPVSAAPPISSAPISSASGGASDRAEQARQRRLEMEKKEAHRRREADDERRQRQLRAERVKVQGRDSLVPMGDIQKRAELQSYDDQQKFVQQGYREMEAVAAKQDQRERESAARDAHVAELKRQMGDGDEAPPPGFTKESWDVHRQIMAADGGKKDRRSSLPPAGSPTSSSNLPSQGSALARAPALGPSAPPAAAATPQVRPDDKYAGKKAGGGFDIDAILGARQEKRNVDKADAAAKLWEEQQKKIQSERERAERATSGSSGSPSGGALPAPTSGVGRLHNADAGSSQPREFDDVPVGGEGVVVVTEWVDVECGDGGDYDAVIAAMQRPSEAPEPPEMFEEAPLPANDISRMEQAVKFTLDGKTLHLKGAGAGDPLPLRVEGLKVFLTESLGGQKGFDVLYGALEAIQNSNVSDEEADAQLLRLERGYGQQAPFVDLMVQLMVCQSMMAAGA